MTENDEVFDFGFTIINEDIDDVKAAHEAASANATDYSNKYHRLEGMIRPFLTNLRDAKGDTIKWPEEMRRDRITSFLEEMDKL